MIILIKNKLPEIALMSLTLNIPNCYLFCSCRSCALEQKIQCLLFCTCWHKFTVQNIAKYSMTTHNVVNINYKSKLILLACNMSS